MAKNIPAIPKDGDTHNEVTKDIPGAKSKFAGGKAEKSTVTSMGQPIAQGRGAKNETANIKQPALTGELQHGHHYSDKPFKSKNGF